MAAVAPLEAALRAAGVAVTSSKSGRPAIFFRDPDGNTLECVVRTRGDPLASYLLLHILFVTARNPATGAAAAAWAGGKQRRAGRLG